MMGTLLVMIMVMIISAVVCNVSVYIGYKLGKGEKISIPLLERKNKRVIRTPEEEDFFDAKRLGG